MRDVARLVDEFEYKTYPTNREFFGSEWTPGVDGDPHLYMAYLGGLGDSIAGYFASNDSLPPVVHRFSNGHEMFFLNADTLDVGEDYASSTLAHEFQHMIHANLDRNEESWMNEGFAELAAFLNGFDVGGSDFWFAQNMDLPLTFWPPETDPLHYGQAFLVMTYFLDRFGEEATKALVATAANGLELDGRGPGGDRRHRPCQRRSRWSPRICCKTGRWPCCCRTIGWVTAGTPSPPILPLRWLLRSGRLMPAPPVWLKARSTNTVWTTLRSAVPVSTR